MKYNLILISALIAILLILAYSNHWNNDFHFDDSHTVQNNIFIRSIKNIPLFFKDCSTFSSIPSHGSYRPVVSTTLAIDYFLAQTFSGNGYQSFWYHLSTFIFFLLQLFLMYFFYAKILSTTQNNSDYRLVGLFAVGWYALNPVMAETINYVISRSDSISTFFVILAFTLYQYVPAAKKYYWYLIPVFIGALAKPTALMFAPMLAVYHILFEQQKGLADVADWRWKKLITTVLPSFLLFGLTYWLIKKMEAGMFEPGGSSLYHYLITQPYVYLHYIAMFILPLQLSADTDWSPFNGINEPGALIGFLFLILLTITAIICSNKKLLRPVSFGIVWFLLALVPTTFVPLAEVMNDHRQFYPHVGTTLAFTWSLFLIYQRWFKHYSYKPLVLVCLLIFCGYAYGTYQRNKVWKSEETLWKDVTEKSPLNGRGLMNYGLALMAKGDYMGAEAYFRRGLELWPYYSYLYINMAIVKEATGKTEEADYYYRKGLEYGKDYPNNYYFYGKYLYKKGEKDKAIEYLRKALEMSTALTDARYLLMDALYETRRLNELQNICTQTLRILPGDQKAITYLSLAKSGKSKTETLEETLRQNPSAEGYLNLSLQYYEDQNYLKCIEAARKALQLKKDYAEAWNNICAAYNAMQMFAEAEKACNEALRIKSDYALARNNLIWAQQNLKK